MNTVWRSALSFYRRWFVVAFRGVWHSTELGVFLFASAADFAKHYVPALEARMRSWLWELPFWVFLALVVLRVFLAPYRIWREDQALVARLQAQAEGLTERRALQDEFSNMAMEANILLHRSTVPGDAALPGDVEAWFNRTQTRLHAIRTSYLQRFNTAGHTGPSTIIQGAQSISSEMATTIRNRIVCLNKFVEELA